MQAGIRRVFVGSDDPNPLVAGKGIRYPVSYTHLMMKESEVTRELVPLLYVLVDGKFVEDLKNLSLKFRGSENQRILDVARSLAAGNAVWMEQYR